MDKVITIKSVIYDMRFGTEIFFESNPYYLRISDRTYKSKKRYDPCARWRNLHSPKTTCGCRYICCDCSQQCAPCNTQCCDNLANITCNQNFRNDFLP